jgi:hypothetical protein
MKSSGISRKGKSEIGKSFVFYEALKTNLVQFPPKPLTRGTRAKSQDASLRKLMSQVSDLETFKRVALEKMRVYEHQIEDLSDHLGRMHSINKQLLHSKLTVNPAEVEFIVSELQSSELKTRLSQFSIENERLRNEIDSLKSQLEKVSADRIKAVEDVKNEVRNSGIVETLSVKSIEDRLSTPRVGVRGFDKTRFGVKNLQMLHKSIADLGSSSSFVTLLSNLSNGAKRVLDCEKVTIFLASNFIQRLYLDYNDPQNPVQKLNLGGSWLLVHNDLNSSSESPVFTHIDEAINGIRSGQDLVEPALINKEIGLIVQCQSSSKGMFEQTDEVSLRVLLEASVCCTKTFISRRKEESLQDQLLEVTNICAAFARSRTFHYLASTVNSLLPSFFDFESAELLYIDEESNEFYGISHSQTLSKFPLTQGMTGEAYSNRSMKIYDSFNKKEKLEEIDNFAKVSEVQNLIIVCLPGPNRAILGVLQLYNKTNNNISPKDIQLVGEMSILLGSVIAMLTLINS